MASKASDVDCLHASADSSKRYAVDLLSIASKSAPGLSHVLPLRSALLFLAALPREDEAEEEEDEDGGGVIPRTRVAMLGDATTDPPASFTICSKTAFGGSSCFDFSPPSSKRSTF